MSEESTIPAIPQYLEVETDPGHYSEEYRSSAVEMALSAMEAGSTLNAVAVQIGCAPSSIWRWISGDGEWLSRYESAKILRSRALMEHALYEMQSANTLDQAKIAEKRAKIYLMHAARLNPKEFSDKVHAMQHKQGQHKGAISFTLNLHGPATEEARALTVVQQPEVGELP